MRAFASIAKTTEHTPAQIFETGHGAPKNEPNKLISSFSSPSIYRKAFCACGGGCPCCSGVIQPKLTIGQPNDIYEQEADRIAEQVMRMPEPTIQTKPG